MRLIQMRIIGVKVSLMQNQQVVSFVFVVNICLTEGFTPLLAKDVSFVGDMDRQSTSRNPYHTHPKMLQLVPAN